MTISINMNDADSATVKKFVTENNLDMEQFFIQAILERIDEEEDAARNYAEAMAEYEKNPKTYRLVEVDAAQ